MITLKLNTFNSHIITFAAPLDCFCNSSSEEVSIAQYQKSYLESRLEYFVQVFTAKLINYSPFDINYPSISNLQVLILYGQVQRMLL